MSEETREKIRAAKQGIPNSPDANEKVRAAMLALPPEERRRRARLGGLAVSGRPRAKRRKKEEADGG